MMNPEMMRMAQEQMAKMSPEQIRAVQAQMASMDPAAMQVCEARTALDPHRTLAGKAFPASTTTARNSAAAGCESSPPSRARLLAGPDGAGAGDDERLDPRADESGE